MDGVFVVVPAAVAVLFFEMATGYCVRCAVATGYCVRFAVQQHLVMLDQTSNVDESFELQLWTLENHARARPRVRAGVRGGGVLSGQDREQPHRVVEVNHWPRCACGGAGKPAHLLVGGA